MQNCIGSLKAVADETRFRILRVLLVAGTPLCVAEIVDIVRKPQYAVSRALSHLSQVGLVGEDRQGKLHLYQPLYTTFNDRLFNVVAADEVDCPWPHDMDRLRWRLDLRQGGQCVITYTAGYAPEEYKQTQRGRQANGNRRAEGNRRANGSRRASGNRRAGYAPDEYMEETERSRHPGGEAAQRRTKRKVLFVCVHNTARSQMAEAYLRQFGGDLFEVESAGLTPGTLNPYVVRVMAEDGFDISHKVPQSVFELYRSGATYSYVITVCSREAEEGCPVFPGPVRRYNWPFTDPSSFTGSDEAIMQKTREVREQVKAKVQEFVDTYKKEYGI